MDHFPNTLTSQNIMAQPTTKFQPSLSDLSGKERADFTLDPDDGGKSLQRAMKLAAAGQLQINVSTTETYRDEREPAGLEAREHAMLRLKALMEAIGLTAFTRFTFSKDGRWFAVSSERVTDVDELVAHLGIGEKFSEILARLEAEAGLAS